MEIFEEFDKLIDSAKKLNESKKVEYKDIPIAPTMETAEQADDFIRGYFAGILQDDETPPPPPGGPNPPLPPTPPPPPIYIKKKERKSASGEKTPWSEAKVEWEEDEFLKRLEIEAEEKEREEEETDIDDTEHDSFVDDEGGPGSGGGSGDDDADDDDETLDDKPHKDRDDEDDEDTDGADSKDGESGKSGKSSSEGDEGDDGEEGEGDGEGESGSSSSKKGDDKKSEKSDSGSGDGEGEDGESGDDGGDTDGGKDGVSTGDDTSKREGGDHKKSGKGRKDGTGGMDDDEVGEEGDDGEGSGKEGKEGEDKEGKGSGEGSGKEDGEEGEDKEGKGGKGDGTGEDEDSKDGEKDGKGGKGSGEGDEDGETGESGESGGKELEDAIRDAIETLKEKNEAEKEDLKELLDMLEDDTLTDEEIAEKEREVEEVKEHGREKMDKLKSLVGRLESPASKEEIEKEIEASKLSDEEIEALKSDTVEVSGMDELPKDEELDALRKKAMEELDKKCKSKSKLSTAILYHSMKDAKIDKTDWDIILEKILKSRSKHNGEMKSKAKKVILGAKNHIWRDVRYGYKTVKQGADTNSIYCFVDYSGSVSSRPGLIISFLGKILEISGRLEFTDIQVYTFGDTLSVPRIITHDMLEKDGYEVTLANTIEFFDMEENNVGGAIENFAEVAYEINKIKSKDQNAIFFIFGDGVWTLYGNDQPPMRLKEICPRYVKDIIPFIFYDDEEDFKWKSLGKEVSILKDVVGIDDVIVTKTSKIKE